LQCDRSIVRHSTLARFIAVLLIVLGISPFTAPFSTCDLTDAHHNGAGQGAWKAPTDPDDALSLPEAAAGSDPLFAFVPAAERVSVSRIDTHRLIIAVLRL
jgi:hypothetical protein